MSSDCLRVKIIICLKDRKLSWIESPKKALISVKKRIRSARNQEYVHTILDKAFQIRFA